jgi:predicted phosphodiesterase
MILNKKQESIYTWLTNKPGYLKCSPKVIAKNYPKESKTKDIEIALQKARLDTKPVSKLQDNNIILSKNFNEDNILVIGDTHYPFQREGYLEHLLKCRTDYNCGTIIHIGDVIDNAYSSFHETNPDGHSAADELEFATEQLQYMYKEFPKAKVCLGNHDLIINRKAFSSGVSKRWIKGLDEVLDVPGWEFDIEHVINGVLFTHGTGTSGQNAAYNKALNRRMSVVQGHLHSEANIRFNVSKSDIIFGMQVGCGVDDRKYAFDYAKAHPRKFIISCGVVLNKGKLPIVLPMNL